MRVVNLPICRLSIVLRPEFSRFLRLHFTAFPVFFHLLMFVSQVLLVFCARFLRVFAFDDLRYRADYILLYSTLEYCTLPESRILRLLRLQHWPFVFFAINMRGAGIAPLVRVNVSFPFRADPSSSWMFESSMTDSISLFASVGDNM